jgi:MFS family permease
MKRLRERVTPWRVLLPVGLGTALSLMGDTALYAVLPTHTAAAGVTLASVGVLLSANRWIRLATNGAAGWAYDRWPRRRLFVPALFIGALSTALYAFTEGFWPLLLGRLLWGLAWSGIWVGGNHMVLEVSGPADRGRWTGLYQFSFYLGGVLGFPAGGLLTDWLGYHAALAAAAGMTLAGALAAWVWLPETRPMPLASHSRAMEAGFNRRLETAAARARSRPAQAGAKVEAVGQLDAGEAQGDKWGWRRGPREASGLGGQLAAITALYGANRFVGAGILTGTLALLVQQSWGAAADGQAGWSGLLLGLSTLVSMGAAPLAGQWSDGRSRWRVAAGLLLPGIVGAGLLAAGRPELILVAVPLIAVAGGSSQGLATALLGDTTPPEKRGRALGWVHTFGDLTSAAAPVLAYAALPVIGLGGLYAACAALWAGMAVWAWAMGRGRGLGV